MLVCLQVVQIFWWQRMNGVGHFGHFLVVRVGGAVVNEQDVSGLCSCSGCHTQVRTAENTAPQIKHLRSIKTPLV